jgi:hypothetical protein
MTNLLKGTLVLILVGWHPGLSAAEKAEVPLTEATPESQNLDSTHFKQAVAKIDDGKYGDMNALLVLRNDYLVLEHYTSPQYYGRDYFALGYGGQFMFVVPHLDMVVVSTAANFGLDESLFLKLLRDHIFPAVLN